MKAEIIHKDKDKLKIQWEKKGVGFGLIATFIYSRAIKLPLLPIMIYYFGIKYTIVLTVVLIVMSIVQGKIIEKIKF